VISPKGISPKLALYVCFEYLSHSLVKTHFPPIFCRASLKPPIPAKRSINLKVGFSGAAKGTESFKSKIKYWRASSAILLVIFSVGYSFFNSSLT